MSEENNYKMLDRLENRIDKLSQKIIGQNETDAYEEETDVNSDVISTLSILGSKLGNALSTRDRMMMVMKRLDELERYLSPNYGDSSVVDDSIKADLILAQEDSLHLQYEQLNLLVEKKEVLDSKHISDSIKLTDTLSEIGKKHYDLEESANDQNQEIVHLLENYNTILSAINENFLRMESMISKVEAAV